MDDSGSTRFRVAVLIFTVVGSIILLTVILLSSSTGNDNGLDLNEFVDPISGERVTSAEGKTPEAPDLGQPDTTFLGFKSLVGDYGFTIFQSEAIQSAVEGYLLDVDFDITEASLYSDSVAYSEIAEDSPLLADTTMKVRVGRQSDVMLRAELLSLSEVRVTISGVDDSSRLYGPITVDVSPSNETNI